MRFIAELKRRNVGKAALLYLVASWLLLQVASVLFDALELPPWSVRLVLGILILGFPLTLIFSWVYEITPDGVKRERAVDQARSTRPDTGRKLNLLIAILLLASTGLLVANRFLPSRASAIVESTAMRTAPAAADTPAGAAANEPSIAVLPLRMPVEDAAGRAVADGLTQSIDEMLSRLAAVRVSGRESTRIATTRATDPREVGRLLEADFVLHGEIADANAGSVALELALLRVDDGATLWSSAFQQPSAQLFRVMGPTLDGVQGVLLPAVPKAGDAFTRTSESAQELYWRARQLFQQDRLGDAQESIELLQRAVAVDPKFGLAYCALAHAWRNYALREDADLQDATARAEAALAQALAIDPKLMCAHVAFAWIRTLQWRAPAADVHIRRALEIDPDNVDALSLAGNMAAYQGRPREALAIHDRAQALDPLSPLPRTLHWFELTLLGRIDEALAATNTDQLSATAGWVAISGIRPRVQIAAGRLADAVRASQAWTEEVRNDVFAQLILVATQAALGDVVAAQQTLNAIPIGRARAPMYGEVRARLFWQGGQYEDALAWIESADGQLLQNPWRLVLRAHSRALAGDEAGALADYEAAFADELDRKTIAYSWYALRYGLGELANWAALREAHGQDATAAREEYARILQGMVDGGVVLPAIDYLLALQYALAGDAEGADAQLGRALEHGWRDTIAIDVDLPWRKFRGTPWLQARREALGALIAAERAALQSDAPMPAG